MATAAATIEEQETIHFETIVIGGGQAGLTAGYYLTRRGRTCLILDANERIGDAWRKRWDSLRLFTPALFSRLPGLPLPAPAPAHCIVAAWVPARSPHRQTRAT